MVAVVRRLFARISRRQTGAGSVAAILCLHHPALRATHWQFLFDRLTCPPGMKRDYDGFRSRDIRDSCEKPSGVSHGIIRCSTPSCSSKRRSVLMSSNSTCVEYRGIPQSTIFTTNTAQLRDTIFRSGLFDENWYLNE